MYRNTRFGDLMKALPRSDFDKLVEHHHSDKYSKGFRSWDQLLAMICAQLSGSRSLRELEATYNSQSQHHYHLGTRSLKRSTLADANARRDSGLFEAVCESLLARTHRRLRRRVESMLYLVDSTPIALKGRGYDQWATTQCTARTQGLKVHLLYASQEQLPVELAITRPNVNDIAAAREFEIEPGATYVFDKAYCDYNWWWRIECAEAVFVTRLKANAGVVIERAYAIPDADQGHILSDEAVSFKYTHPGGGRRNHYRGPVRRIVVDRPDKASPLVVVTNDFERPASEIAMLYKSRWDIELFFKWLKQNLKIKRFLGRSENAVRIQIYTALITYLLVALYRRRHGLTDSMRLCVAVLGTTLFQRPDVERQADHRRRRQRQEIARLQSCFAL